MSQTTMFISLAAIQTYVNDMISKIRAARDQEVDPIAIEKYDARIYQLRCIEIAAKRIAAQEPQKVAPVQTAALSFNGKISPEGFPVRICSNCEEEIIDRNPKVRFCANCGARFQSKEE